LLEPIAVLHLHHALRLPSPPCRDRAKSVARPSPRIWSALATKNAGAGLHFRWHDCRHTIVSRLAESPAISEQMIMTLAGHVSKSMLARYSHIRSGAKQAAIATLETPDFEGHSPKNPPSRMT